MKNNSFENKDYEYESQIDFVKELNFTNEEILLNLAKIHQIHNDLNDCKNSGSDECIHDDQEHEMFFRNKYNKLETTYVKCSKQKNNFSYNYLVKDFDDSFLNIKFLNKNIDIKGQNKDYRFKIIKELKHQYIEKSFRNLFLFGGMGVGKTYIVVLFCNFLVEKNKTIAFVNMNNLVNKFKESRDIYRPSEVFLNTIQKMKDADILVIDELGIEVFNNKLHTERLIPLLFDRNLNQKITYFISNYDLKKLKLKYQNTIKNIYYKNIDTKDFDLKNVEKFIQQIHVLVKKNTICLEGDNWIQKNYYGNR